MKRTEWLPRVCQLPWAWGVMTGWAPCRALATGVLKVRVIGVSGASGVPGAGETTALAPAPAGNQLIGDMRALSQVRGAAATEVVPAAPVRGRVTTVVGLVRTRRTAWPPTSVTSTATGALKCRVTGAEPRTVT